MNNNFLRAILGILVLIALALVSIVIVMQRDVILNHHQWQTISVIDRHQPIGDLEGEVVISEETEMYILNARYPRSVPAEVRESVDRVILEFKELETISGVTYTLDMDVQTYIDTEYTSYVLEYYMYTGGANGNGLYETFVYQDGSKLRLADVLSDTVTRESISDALRDKLDELYPDQWFGTGIEPNSPNLENFFFTDGMISFAFSEYAVGPGVLGPIIVSLPLSEIQTTPGYIGGIDPTIEVTDFWSCVDATGIVMESYPRQCVHDGVTYVEKIPEPIVPIGDKTGCVVAGCSSQLCISAQEFEKNGGISTCEFLPHYMCFREATCAYQANGECGWTEDDEFKQCMSDHGQ